ncbi:MAG: VOC family protein [Chloroflexota bacterium]|nr:VOC family protein [Chloroflexota bacterium]
MITHVGTSIVFVRDQDKAKDFYVNTLGFTLKRDVPMYPGATNRWLTVLPTPDAQTEILLDVAQGDFREAYQAEMIGKSQTLLLTATDVVDVIRDLKAKGVTIVSEPQVQDFGTMATIADQDGNQILIVELPTAP